MVDRQDLFEYYIEMKNNYNLKGKNALVTGAAGLLGIEHTKALLENNAFVVMTDISKSALSRAKEFISLDFPNPNIIILEMDVTDKISINNVKDYLNNKNLSINILLNNAAIDPKVKNNSKSSNLSRLEDFEIDEWNSQLAVGLTGSFLCCQTFGSEMAKSGKAGVILNIASDLSVIAPDQRLYKIKDLPDHLQPVKPVTYSVVKTGIIGLTKYLATYWSEKGIRCNALSPGGVMNNQPEEFVESISNLIPLGRMANKDEYRSAIQFLCSDASIYMNGHNLVMDGGRSIW